MKRNQIISLLRNYNTTDAHENGMLQNMLRFIETNTDCFERSLLIGHVTGSAWILNKERTHALLMHHKKLNKWFQPGGHCDGDADVMHVAAKEAFEETGLEVNPISTAIFDVDHHQIPESKGIPEHTHYDIRFLFEANRTTDELASNSEARAVRWIALEEIDRYNNDESIMRMVRKSVS
ncbi:NUDIX hydrolase [Pseudoflavitalea sp. G-6-1-2]|uniref:NUDIX hydrolase n=1 Tax=Pseudoflavitalea sp. G-6-1-2 TaxID=2728841 RepID=UPI00146B0FC8|nr:NUDIX hydrolase [Pseudoflavitalea sp. G-6-1-2]NML19997.1 NUDIX hydrolase [Pseudoflavitalea sp. G-6-1-2]